MAFYGGARRSIGIICSKMRSGHHGFSTIAVKRNCSGTIVDDVQFNMGFSGLFLRRYSAASSSDQMGLIKQLRERTSAPIKDVKSALVDCNWDIDAAQKELRKRGVYLASKKSSRAATEGLLALAQDDTKTAIIELNCETDFVARNDIFQYMALSLAKLALSAEGSSQQVAEAFPVTLEYLESLKLNLTHPKLSGEKSVQEAVVELAAMMGENVKLRRGFALSKTSPGVISTYLHSSPQSGVGRMAAILSLQVENPNVDLAALQRVGSELAMHVVASKPLFLSKELVSSDALDNEREILRSQAEASGKPKMAIEKMVEGRIRKYLEEVVLLEQKYVLDDTVNVKTVLDNLSKEVGSPVKIESFFRLAVGEGIESSDASESEQVAQTA
ncbi:elongation factor Ts, mitochondrial-like [Chenopodium quinoa]|uniref:Elongation factor Ts, mitochondrial n=1 Tax=Chenopodium quinoa TaxID=63459 RepID=A0A803MXB5_CHEQI|nr:elongation factor Ts, mitochondrial-like [Chenopodium quinoa]XP_021732190.1 elongation factor Ts, mitochondrial-like [Chenopodium quinoa]